MSEQKVSPGKKALEFVKKNYSGWKYSFKGIETNQNKIDCSHLVNQAFKGAGHPYSYRTAH